jgi:hypothetical protein
VTGLGSPRRSPSSEDSRRSAAFGAGQPLGIDRRSSHCDGEGGRRLAHGIEESGFDDPGLELEAEADPDVHPLLVCAGG